MKTRPTTELGFFAEYYAAEYLKKKDYEILGHNFRKPWGEIDIIARKQGILVFVEVKANSKEMVGFEPENRVNEDKKYRMVRIAQTYLANQRYPEDQEWQLDVIGVTLNKLKNTVQIKHFKNIE